MRGICKQTVDRDKRRKRRKYRKKAVEGHARGERKYPVVRNVSVDAQQNVFPAARGNFRGGARVPAPSGFERLARRAVAAVPRSKSPCPRMAGFFFFTVRHQVRHRNSGGERCKRSERRGAAADFIRFSGWHRRGSFPPDCSCQCGGTFLVPGTRMAFCISDVAVLGVPVSWREMS